MNQIVVLTGYEEKKTGTSKRGPWALRLFEAAGGTKFQTFDVDLGEKAIGLIGQSAELEYELEENGDFKNNVIKSIKAANGNGASTADHVAVQQAVNNATSGVESDRQLRIMRQSALDRAINTVAAGIGGYDPREMTDKELFHIADQFILYFEQGSGAFE